MYRKYYVHHSKISNILAAVVNSWFRHCQIKFGVAIRTSLEIALRYNFWWHIVQILRLQFKSRRVLSKEQISNLPRQIISSKTSSNDIILRLVWWLSQWGIWKFNHGWNENEVLREDQSTNQRLRLWK
jgi:hypothetical protein